MNDVDLLKDLQGPVTRLMERLTIKDNYNRRLVKYKLFPKQKELCDLLEKEKYVVINKSRVVGGTTTLAAFIASTLFRATPDEPENITIVCDTFVQSEEFLAKVKDFLIQFHQMFFDSLNKKDMFTKNRKRELVLTNGSRITARSSDPSCLCGVGGVTWAVFDESALISRGEDVYASVLPTLVTGGRVTMISTPNGKDRLHYEACRRAGLKGTNEWNGYELFEMRWYEDPRYNKGLKWFKSNDGIDETIEEEYHGSEYLRRKISRRRRENRYRMPEV
jgi:hypothetical protein